ncbi:hypothetical protein KSF73_09060 [Burkholderiaceae bacterium DAT-1]|nr:hypothetical protein [Burkholderiaceae bacterium DAT-1]
MLGELWRWLVAICDYRAWWRILTGQPVVDVVFISNLRDEAERQRFFGRWRPASGHANGPRVYHNGVAARVRGIDVTAEELMTREGRRKAQAHFISACEWAEKRGARVVLLAASTKRLFGRDGRTLKAHFPNLLFTIGDNGTANMLWRDIERAMNKAGLNKRSRVLVIGPYGILGEAATDRLIAAGHEVVGYGGNVSALAEIKQQYGIEVGTQIRGLGKVDAVIACTHSQTAKLTPACIESLRRPGRKLLVVDVAEPANLDIDTHAKVRELVVRQDAGNAFGKRLHYVLGPLAWSKLMLSRGVVFGCFAEAIALYQAIHKRGERHLMRFDWFSVNPLHMELASLALEKASIDLPHPCCFGEKVDSFDLSMHAVFSDPPTRPTPQVAA